MEFLYKPWPWYITGPLIGLMVPALLIFGNKHFGISSTMRHICAACLPTKNPFFNYDWKKESWNLILALGIVLGGFVANNFMSKNNVPLELSNEGTEMFGEWGILDFNFSSKEEPKGKYLSDIITNTSILSADGTSENSKNSERIIMPTEIFSFSSFSSPIGWIFMVLGGFLVGFGTRWANGCTSGHAIMGLSLLNPGSLVAVIGFFIGGLAVSWFVIPNLL